MPLLESELDPRQHVPPELIEPTNPAERERLLREAEAEIDAGQGISHERVKAWIQELAAGGSPPPLCDL